MSEERDSDREAILQNLKDAGCDPSAIAQFFNHLYKGEADSLMRLLTGHREELLNQIHKDERRIDCLDYLIHQIKQNKIARVARL